MYLKMSDLYNFEILPLFFQGFPDSILDCRGCDSAQTVHPECWPIPVPKNDPYFPALNTTSGQPHCIAFTRSLPGQQRLGPREQVNQNTAFIDASQIYGNDICDAADLREGIDGRLNTSLPVTGRGKHLLPKTTKNKECKAASGYCFYGGDSRVSEQPGLAAMHTIFLREHNRLTSQLKVKAQSPILSYHSHAHSHSGYSSHPLGKFLPTCLAQAVELGE